MKAWNPDSGLRKSTIPKSNQKCLLLFLISVGGMCRPCDWDSEQFGSGGRLLQTQLWPTVWIAATEHDHRVQGRGRWDSVLTGTAGDSVQLLAVLHERNAQRLAHLDSVDNDWWVDWLFVYQLNWFALKLVFWVLIKRFISLHRISFSTGSAVQSLGGCAHRQDCANQLESTDAGQLFVVQAENHWPLRPGHESQRDHWR